MIEQRIETFVSWIATDAHIQAAMNQHGESVRKKIKKEAEAAGLIIQSMPNAGSYEKKTGLRSYKMNGIVFGGQDVDQPFIVERKDKLGKEVTKNLQDLFYSFVEKAYGNKVEAVRSKRAIRVEFDSGISVDVVPMFVANAGKKQTLQQSNWDNLQTSIKQHNDFVKRRNAQSNEMKGVVKFNECVRLMKWWRSYQTKTAASDVFSKTIEDRKRTVSSYLITLLCAKVFDTHGVEKTYAKTLHKWFDEMEYLVSTRTPIYFTDYTSHLNNNNLNENFWTVIDPVNAKNPMAKKWGRAEVNELASWLDSARALLKQAIDHDKHGAFNKSKKCLSQVFGAAFSQQCDQ